MERSRNVGYLAIVECTTKLCTQISIDPLKVSQKLLEKGVVSEVQVRNSLSQHLDDYTKASMLLDVVTRQIQVFPEKFEALLCILGQIPWLEDVVELIKEKCSAKASALDHHFSQDNEVLADIAAENKKRLELKYASLITNIAEKLAQLNINIEHLKLHIAIYLGEDMQKLNQASSITDVFIVLSGMQKWKCDAIAPLEEICIHFGRRNSDLMKLINEYKSDIAGFKATTRIIDHMNAMDLDKVARSNDGYFHDLSCKLGVNISEKCLDYIDQLWASLVVHLRIPPLPAILRHIQAGCIEVTWRISANTAQSIRTMKEKLKEVAQHFQIIRVELDQEILHGESLEEKDKYIQELQDAVQSRDMALKDKSDLIARLQSELLKTRLELKEMPPLDFQFKWKCGTDMPFGMDGNVQAVVVEGRIYVGGGDVEWDDDANYSTTVMEYDTSSREWDALSPYETSGFAMTVVNGHVLLVGGYENDGPSKLLGMWQADHKEWVYPYPDMPTGRYDCSAIVYNQWLVVAGGVTNLLSVAVDVLDIESLQWHAGPPLPQPWRGMKVAVTEDTCYFIGGTPILYGPVQLSCSVSMKTLISHITSDEPCNETDESVWKDITSPPHYGSSPLSISGYLLAIGGLDSDDQAVSTISLYQTATEEWMRIGDLLSPRYCCTCAKMTNREVVVIGGTDDKNMQRRTDIAFMSKCS